MALSFFEGSQGDQVPVVSSGEMGPLKCKINRNFAEQYRPFSGGDNKCGIVLARRWNNVNKC
jgi:hypothetical protein